MKKSSTNLSSSQSVNMGARVDEKRDVGPELKSKATYGMYGRRYRIPLGQIGRPWSGHSEKAKESLREKKERRREGRRQSE